MSDKYDEIADELFKSQSHPKAGFPMPDTISAALRKVANEVREEDAQFVEEFELIEATGIVGMQIRAKKVPE